MRDLVLQSGLPRTTIHHYIRERLLPPAKKSSRNAALYGEEHLDRLRLIGELREEAAGALSIPQVRKVLAHMGTGMTPAAAARLVTSGIEPTASPGVHPDLLEAMVTANLIDRAGESPRSAGDLLVARSCDALVGMVGVDLGDLTPLSDLIREVGEYAESLAALYATQAEAASQPPGPTPGQIREGIRHVLDALLWRSLET